MLVRLVNDTIVRYKKGTVLDLSEDEARRLMAFGNAVIEEEKIIETATVEPAETRKRTRKKQ